MTKAQIIQNTSHILLLTTNGLNFGSCYFFRKISNIFFIQTNDSFGTPKELFFVVVFFPFFPFGLSFSPVFFNFRFVNLGRSSLKNWNDKISQKIHYTNVSINKTKVNFPASQNLNCPNVANITARLILNWTNLNLMN